jgi:hypothetical protein
MSKTKIRPIARCVSLMLVVRIVDSISMKRNSPGAADSSDWASTSFPHPSLSHLSGVWPRRLGPVYSLPSLRCPSSCHAVSHSFSLVIPTLSLPYSLSLVPFLLFFPFRFPPLNGCPDTLPPEKFLKLYRCS